ncbi:hypothetical protein ACHAQI_005567 [Fusarium lateritium]
MPTTVIQSKEEYDELLQSHKYAVVYASASWVGRCKAIDPYFDKHADEYDDVSEKIAFIKFDMEEVPGLAQELLVRSVPTFFAFEDGELADRKFVHDFCNKSREK